jgi:hypothetical protein
MTKIKSIIHGWTNDLKYKLGLISPPVKQLFDARLSICNSNECGKLLLGICTACGCPVSKKAKSVEETCPENYWNPLIYEGMTGDIFILYNEVPPLVRPILESFLINLPDQRGENYIKKFSAQDMCLDGVYVELEDWEAFLKELQ